MLVLALVHLMVQLAHGWSHIEVDVSLSAMQQVFIYVVATFMPLAAIYVALRKDMRLGAGLFAVSMAAAFLFGYLAHFVIDSPDLHSNVVGDHANFFFHSALSLAIIEFAGFAFGFTTATRKPREESASRGAIGGDGQCRRYSSASTCSSVAMKSTSGEGTCSRRFARAERMMLLRSSGT